MTDDGGTMGRLDGQGAIVTGGSRGIGRAIVLRLVADGATVVFTYQQDEAAAKQVAEETDGRAVPVRVDLGVMADVAALFEAADQHLDALDILVNNAGTAVATLIADVTESDYDRLMAVNAKGVFFTIQHAIRRMRDGGRIVSISSANTVMAGPGVAVYAASKAAVEQFTRVAARELGSRGITVNSVSPGATDTDLLRGTNSPEGLQRAEQMTPLGRLGQPADVADVVAFLLGPDGRWMTGQNLVAAGGLI
ncbi:SDR family oxidoreductase [Micromonospora sonneratiae]|uniref:SDR family oxidoreductase n=1 Tax=Micromonospora sonneratiae TaxID=1184706 RepID=A0ABW3YBI2_9ACTN